MESQRGCDDLRQRFAAGAERQSRHLPGGGRHVSNSCDQRGREMGLLCGIVAFPRFRLWRMPLDPKTGATENAWPTRTRIRQASFGRFPSKGTAHRDRCIVGRRSGLSTRLFLPTARGLPISPDASGQSGFVDDECRRNGCDAVSTEPEPEFEHVRSADSRSTFSLQRGSRTEIWHTRWKAAFAERLGKRRRTALAESCPKRRICALPSGQN
jgi:hypothetical protein